MEKKLLEIINTIRSNRSQEDLSEITPGMHLRNDLGLDSLDLAELTVRIEVEYDVDVFEDGIVNTISEIMVKINK